MRPSPLRGAPALTPIRTAYATGARAWAGAPARIYRRLADHLVAISPEPLAGRSVLDLGSGTGVGAAAAIARAARVVAVDLAVAMLLEDRASRPPGAAGDACALPFRDDAFDVVLAAFSLNHLDDPAAGAREAGRVGRLLLASTSAAEPAHPVRYAVDSVLAAHGWEPPAWYVQLQTSMAAWGSVDAATAVIEAAGLRPVRVAGHAIAYPDLQPLDLVEWRLGLAQCAGFVATLDDDRRAAVVADALGALGPDPEPLVRRVIFLSAVRAS